MPYLAVALGGGIGACLRYLISEWVGTVHGFPAATLGINLAGSFFLAWFYTITLERVAIHPHLRLGIGTGLVGAFTTFSTFTSEVWSLLAAHAYLWALLYVLLSFVGGLALAALGFFLAHWQNRLNLTDDVSEEA
ncbi:fluoride efflux transporter CrcB [Alicyclobacillus shizuokensis]|uniref:fluoride efflux transporter CrcB n=1 Tax=Alicyclobacillus shizuokensis TaxID=392014 RepID=UPI00082A6341|nr:fluoride efflux transporter CrcB [Alicyclobacillus shizuokensis]MCL6625671.1 fluoride efflux transporter CrcB [Alicyclobacillus shizuokensis]